ncbi:type 2 isopentenyl-diphosphate Delta-isomerase [Siminovitchia fortis]|uniref:Isopentenyl-diphosphate delta-isomerase n=1 Tax=Siminovitchia fortis TaxID=254758 RepID=A0A443J0I5_9BACI|nr:type 2 isopentenyl-diphosphate Delta-isomerase [Siminovitchia fortis]RWR13947.1 type 2 isopentenyl-diphosphate Delta-isomerase [Siminovitchia fortis]WHY81205.1 type 2 isopentenyl-diphosphate Delta-isomerase [Siminovitchia fortis]
MANSIEQRKSEHIQITLNEKVTGESISTGLESFTFIHNALPEIAFDEISIETTFLGFECKTPFLISSMTGGTALAETINRNLAAAAEERGWVLALGSTRALLDSDGHSSSFMMRKYAPSVPVIANLGAVQLNYGYGVEECRKIIGMTEADMLVLHLNSIQEVIQEKGDTNFKGLLKKIEQLCSTLEVPVGIKEVGWGIDGQTAKKLAEAGVAFIDVAGAGGTSWSQVEKFRAKDPIRRAAAQSFSEWGIPTVESIKLVRGEIGDRPLIASGGMQTGLDGAKTIALGADLVGFGRSILKEATQSPEDVIEVMKIREMELRMSMFGIGASTIQELKGTPRLKER